MRLPSIANSTTLSQVQPEDLSDTFSNHSGMIYILFLLVFYALALWDRWLNLRLRTEENRHLQEAINKLGSYGSVAGATTKLRSPTLESGIRESHEVSSPSSPLYLSPPTSTFDVKRPNSRY